MELHIRICIVLLGTLMYSIPRFHECRKLEGYKFPTYSTEFCPRNETEWNKRSSALKCNETNGYTCLPNERFTELLEFCYTQPRIWIEAGTCLVLVKKVSLVHGYKCHGFFYGCPSSSYLSSSIFEYPTCIHLRDKCFFAESTCKSKQTHLQDTTDVIFKKPDSKTTPNPQTTTTQTEAKNPRTNNYNSGIIIGAILGVIVIGLFTTVLICIIRRKKKLGLDSYGNDDQLERSNSRRRHRPKTKVKETPTKLEKKSLVGIHVKYRREEDNVQISYDNEQKKAIMPPKKRARRDDVATGGLPPPTPPTEVHKEKKGPKRTRKKSETDTVNVLPNIDYELLAKKIVNQQKVASEKQNISESVGQPPMVNSVEDTAPVTGEAIPAAATIPASAAATIPALGTLQYNVFIELQFCKRPGDLESSEVEKLAQLKEEHELHGTYSNDEEYPLTAFAEQNMACQELPARNRNGEESLQREIIAQSFENKQLDNTATMKITASMKEASVINRRKSSLESDEEEKKIKNSIDDHQRVDWNSENHEALPFKKNQIRQWKKENSDFYSTQACKDVEQRTKNQSVVMVIGHPGTGKSAIIQHIALQYKNERWILEPLQSIMDFEKTFSSKNKTLYIIKDPFGKNAFQKKEWEYWLSNEEAIESCLTKSCSKMLMSCQKYIFLDIRIKSRFKDCPYVVDITEVECKLTLNEKRQLLRKYTTHVDFADECARKVEIEAYFPRLCKLYSKEGDLNLFLKPEEVLNSELKCLREENRELFCALIVLAISDDNFCMEDLENMSETESKCVSDECGINGIAPYFIKDKLDSMDGFLVKKKNSDNTDFPKDIYIFYNKDVQEIFESCFKDIITRIKKKV